MFSAKIIQAFVLFITLVAEAQTSSDTLKTPELEQLKQLATSIFETDLSGSCGQVSVQKASDSESDFDFHVVDRILTKPFINSVQIKSYNLNEVQVSQLLSEALRVPRLSRHSLEDLSLMLIRLQNRNDLNIAVFTAYSEGEFSTKLSSLLLVDRQNKEALLIQDGYCE